jgi:hypothetical protein
MATNFDWVDSSVVEDIDTTFSATFSAAQGSRLELHRLGLPREHHGEASAKSDLWYRDISTREELQDFAVSRALMSKGPNV